MKIVLLCRFSNSAIRNKLKLKNYTLLNLYFKIRNVPQKQYDDFAIWISDYIAEFEKHSEHEFHIVAPHKGMKNDFQNFDINGIYYHFFKGNSNYISDVLNEKFHIQEKNDYQFNRNKIKIILGTIQPDIVLLCGAENPHYALGVIDIYNKPIYVILQTLLNDPKRIGMGVGNEYRRRVENDIFKHANYFCTYNELAINYIKECNSSAHILPVRFPTHCPKVTNPNNKSFDFVFFARIVTKNKGIEDIINALIIIVKKYPSVRLNIIGRVSKEYKIKLEKIIEGNNIFDNIIFSGYYQQLEDTYKNVANAKVVVVPGITEPLNSTVRESMLMGQPTICYEAPSTLKINEVKQCLFLAKMRDINDLAKQMIITLDDYEKTNQVALNGKEYAEKNFSNKAIVNQLLENCELIVKNYYYQTTINK